MLEYLKSKEDFVNAIVKHLGTSAVMDLLLRLITSVESPQLRQDLLEVKFTVCNARANACYVVRASVIDPLDFVLFVLTVF